MEEDAQNLSAPIYYVLHNGLQTLESHLTCDSQTFRATHKLSAVPRMKLLHWRISTCASVCKNLYFFFSNQNCKSESWFCLQVIFRKSKAVPLRNASAKDETCSSYSFSSALDGVSGQSHAPAALYPRIRTPGTHCTGGWVDIRTGLDTEARGKHPLPLQSTEPRSSSLYSDTILTELPQIPVT
jgi:hypothetical protein